jgi:hypothetical protein
MAKKEEVQEVKQAKAAVTQPEVKFVSKLTPKNMGAKPTKILGLPEEVPHSVVAVVMGICVGFKQIDDPEKNESYFPLIGQFQSVNPDDGVKTQSGVLYLPAGIHDSYLAAAKKLKDGEELRFAVEIRSVRASNKAGRTYEAVNLLKATASNPLDNILAAISNDQTPQLTSGE